MRNFINAFKPVTQEKPERKLYAEADDELNPDLEIEEEEVPVEPEPAQEPEEIEEETMNENEFNFDNPEFMEDSGDVNADPSMADSENMFQEGEEEDTPAFRRKVRKLNEAFSSLYDQYADIVNKLNSLDVTGDKATVINRFISRYSEMLKALNDYTFDNDDTWVVRFQTFVEFRASFILINNDLAQAQKEADVLK